MSAGTLIIIGLLAAAFGGFIRIWTKTTPEPPDGVTLTLTHQLGSRRVRSRWHYIINDRRAMSSTGYLTRNSAIRAAQQELDRLHAKDQQTS